MSVVRRAPKPYSLPRTTEVVLEVVCAELPPEARVLDFGTGEGYFVDRLRRALGQERTGVELSACDARPESYVLDDPPCDRVGPDLDLPYADGTFDVVIAIEVLEHIDCAGRFFVEVRRVLRPGGRLVVTTPNVLSLNSRVRTFLYGFAEMFDVLPLANPDPVHFGGHVSPISLYYACHRAVQSGFEVGSFRIDRSKRSASALAVLVWPILKLAEVPYRARLRRKQPRIFEENRRFLDWINSWALLTGRTVVLELRRAETDPRESVARETAR